VLYKTTNEHCQHLFEPWIYSRTKLTSVAVDADNEAAMIQLLGHSINYRIAAQANTTFGGTIN
jgi:hypothetical protein